jgi:hypothetical protein
MFVIAAVGVCATMRRGKDTVIQYRRRVCGCDPEIKQKSGPERPLLIRQIETMTAGFARIALLL